MSFQTSHGPVSVIEAADLRNYRGYSRSPRDEIPINAAYYMRPTNAPRPYDQMSSRGGYQQQQQQQQQYSTYQQYPQQQYPPVQQYPPAAAYPIAPRSIISAPPPARSVVSGVGGGPYGYQNGTDGKTVRSYYEKRTVYKSKSGKSINYGDSTTQPSVVGRYYTSPKIRVYSTIWRVVLKILEICFGAVYIGCIAGVTYGVILHEFTQNTKSEGQIAMIVISSVLMFGTFLFLVTIVYAQRSRAWRISDLVYSGFCIISWIVIAGVEAWYAACYPPIGPRYQYVYNGRACKNAEWAVATIFGYFNVILYFIDFILGTQGQLTSWLL